MPDPTPFELARRRIAVGILELREVKHQARRIVAALEEGFADLSAAMEHMEDPSATRIQPEGA